jgi:hypothetical protein
LEGTIDSKRSFLEKKLLPLTGLKEGKELPEACNVELNYSYMVEDNRRDPSACAR